MAPNSRVVRTRKLSTRIGLQIIREKELDVVLVEHDQQQQQQQSTSTKVETGVEKHEETEHHLQAAIASQAAAVGGKSAQVYIPTPETVSSSVPYKQLYQARFSQPSTLIRFSSTVEDCCGVSYNLTEEDDVFLKELNDKLASKRGSPGPCSEDQFEIVMNFFEETVKSQQPFSNVGEPPPILTFDELQALYDENIDESSRQYAKDIYEHWKALRSKNGNTAVQPGLKLKIMESATDADDSDPYVCFRRREVRQVRKTRGRDAQSVEKLKKLRIELEAARNLVQLVKARELAKRDHLLAERRLFEQRTELRRLKRGLPDPHKDGDEDLLINQRAPKKRLTVDTSQQRLVLQQPRQPIQRPDGKSTEQELINLDDLRLKKDQDIAKEVAIKKVQHQRWNLDYVDCTNQPLTPPPSAGENSSFRQAMTKYLPTPPASNSGDEDNHDGSKDDSINIRYDSISPDSSNNFHSFRRRRGRGGRMMIDRRVLPLRNKSEIDPKVSERYKFDDSDDDMLDLGQYISDSFDINNMRYRAAVCANAPAHTVTRSVKPAVEQSSTNASTGQPSNPAGNQSSGNNS